MENHDDLHAHCDECGLLAFNGQPCGTCGPKSVFCAEHRWKCPVCEEFFCHDDAPMHRALCLSINQKAV